MTVEIMNKKFTLSLSTIIAIVTTVTTIVGVYWKIHNEISLKAAEVRSLQDDVQELKTSVKEIQQTLWDVTVSHNQTIKESNPIIRTNRRHLLSSDTIDLKPLKRVREIDLDLKQ